MRLLYFSYFTFSFAAKLSSQWNERYMELVEFQKEFGHCNVPRNHINQKLANWAHNQKTEFKLVMKGSPSPLTPARRELLEKIGFKI